MDVQLICHVPVFATPGVAYQRVFREKTVQLSLRTRAAGYQVLVNCQLACVGRSVGLSVQPSRKGV